VSVRPKDIVLAAVKVRVDLPRQQRVFGNVRAARVLIEGQQEEEKHAGEDAQQRGWRGDLQYSSSVSDQGSESSGWTG
jgi:hypothetical protein